MYKTVETEADFQQEISENDFVLVYFSHEQCNVCKVLKPKISELITSDFPNIKLVYTDTVKSPFLAGQNSVFAVPTLIIFISGKEYSRFSRNIGLYELERTLERPYKMIFD